MNCLLIHSMEVNSNEDTDKLVLDVIHDDLEINVRKLVIDRTHRIGDPKKKEDYLPIIVKFVRYYDSKEASSMKNYSKGKGISIT